MVAETPNVAAVLHAAATDVTTERREIPSPGPDEILVRNYAIAVNPVDWKRQAWGYAISSYPTVLGSDVSGVVVAVGSHITKFKAGDRVSGFADGFVSGKSDHGAFQTYTILTEPVTSPLPESLSFEQGAMFPMGTSAAVMALVEYLGLPKPTLDGTTKPFDKILLLWGASSAVGSMAIQFAVLAGITVFATASAKNHSYVRSLGAAEVFDYKSPTVVEDLAAAAKKAGKPIAYALDNNSDAESLKLSAQVLTASSKGSSKLATLLDFPEGFQFDGVETIRVQCEKILLEKTELAVWLFHEFLPAAIDRGAIVPSPRLTVAEGGIGGLQKAMNFLKEGHASAEKLVVKVD